MNYTMRIFGLILFVGTILSSTVGQISITQPTVVDYPESELQSSAGLNPTTISETSTLLDGENDDQDCICTPYHMCKSHVSDYDGSALINIRINIAPCQSYLDVCCNDTKITSTENYSSGDNSKEPNIDQIAITNMPSEVIKQDFTIKPFDGQIADNTTEPNVSHNEDNTKNPSDVPTEEYTNMPPEVGTKEDNTTKPLDSQIPDNTKEPSVTDNENNITNPSDSPNVEFTNKISESTKGDNAQNSLDGQKEEQTKEPCICPTEDSTKKPFDSQSENLTKDPSVDHSYVVTDKSITPEQIITTESDKTTADQQEQQKCGAWNKNGVGFRIGDATDNESEFGEFPSMVAIFKEELSKDGEKNLVLHCGGSLIEKDVILTATHCVIKEDISTLVVRAGEWDLKTEKEALIHQDRRVLKIVTHPNYNANGIHNDVALIFTDTSFSLQENIKLICLPSADDIYINDMCYSSGWGKTVSYNNYTIIKKTESGKTKETGQYQVSILKKVELPIVPRNKCMDALRATRLGPKFVLHDSFICAGGQEGKDTCKGDGGSPLMCPYKDDPERLVQVGIVAWGINCGLADIPAAYVNVAGFTYWIKNEIANRG